MDFWPTGYIQHSSVHQKGKGGDATGKTTADSGSGAHPIVEQGSVAAANLIRQGRRVEWTCLGLNDTGRRLRANHPAKIFPATYPKAPGSSSLNITHKAEQGAQFLRTHYPDVDIASDVIRAELTEDALCASASAEMDPFDGNKLAFLTLSERTRRKSTYLAFPVGPTGRDLNISPLTYNKRDPITFRPTTKVVKSLDTPIDQIIGYYSDSPDALQGTYMALRTVGSTHLTQVRWEGGTSEGVSVDILASWTRSQTGQKHLVDVLFPNSITSRHASLLAVTEQGQIYSCFADSQRSTQLVYTPPVSEPDDKFWRVIRTSSSDTFSLLSTSTLSMIDFRSASESIKLLTATHEPLTCAEVPGTDHMVRALSTSEIFWFDQRFARSPLISYKHGRQGDRTLQVQTVPFSNGPLTFLTSSRSNLVTVYDVSQADSGVIHLNTPAYSLPSLEVAGRKCMGSALIRHPSDTAEESAILFRLTDRGAIHRIDLTISENGHSTGSTYVWSEEVTQLAKKSEDLEPEYGQLGERMYNDINLEQPVERIFALSPDDSQENGETVYNTLDAMRHFWSTTEEPIHSMLTASDIAFRSGDEPGAPSRTDFTTGNSLNSKRGFRALLQHRIPLEQLSKDAAWHHDILPVVNKFIPEMAPSPDDLFDNLRSHDLQMDDYRTGPSIRREDEAREQLTLDLSLSTDIYAPNPLKRQPDLNGGAEDDAFETMSRATEAMSIGVPEPPAVHFGFLQPDFSEGDNHYAEDKDNREGKPQQPLGVRLLLKDWEIGIDPESYTYYDPYGIAGVAAPRPTRPTRLPPVNETAFRPAQQTQSQKAPPVIASSMLMAPPPIISSQPARVVPKANWQSQDVSMAAPRVGSQNDAYASQGEFQTQEVPVPSTQVLAGPFGGRPTAKKKTAKKRLGGF